MAKLPFLGLIAASCLMLPAIADEGCAPIVCCYNMQSCAGGTVIINGKSYSYWAFYCRTGETCSYKVIVNESGEITSVTGWCTNCANP